MKKITKKGYAILSCILVACTIISASSFYFFTNANKDTVSTVTRGGDNDYASVQRDTAISVDSSGVLQISRKQREQEVPMGKENTWTILLYMAGTNLESQYLSASQDIREMFAAKITEENIKNVNFIIQTGACDMWHSNNIAEDKIQRYKLDAGSDKLTLLQELPNASMGSPDTLYNFLDWGVANYPAEHMGVIFWNHGSGVSHGVCVDPLFDDDSLSVHEIEYAFAKAKQKMTSKFEMISFDTCLSGSIEYANILAPYAKYMIASGEIEPGDGWYYTDFINFLLENPDATGAELGKVICDAYASFYEEEQTANRPIDYTLSTYDLSKVDKVCVETNYLTKFLYDNFRNNPGQYWTLAGMMDSRLKYARDNVDLGSLLDYFDTRDTFNYNTTYYKQALNDFIIYKRISKSYQNRKANGLTLYAPYNVMSLQDLNTYRNVCFSPYWLKYLELMNKRNMTEDLSRFKETKWESSPFFFEQNFNFINYDDYSGMGYDDNSVAYNILITNPEYSNSDFVTNWYENFDISHMTFGGGFMPPHLQRDMKITVKDNTLTAQVNKDSIKDVNNVYSSIFTKVDDSLVCLGENNQVTYNKETGDIKSNFNGEWFMLPDGQLLTTYIISSDENNTVYGFPVMINDTESTIRIQETKQTDGKFTYETLGVWDANSNNFNNKEDTGRGYLPLKSGTTITPIYDVFDTESNKYESEYGEEYTVKSDFDFLFGKLDNGEYSFAYEIEKLNGSLAFSELTKFSVADKKVNIKK